LYELRSKLGEGSTCKVYLGKNIVSGKNFAIKIIERNYSLKMMNNETHILKKVNGHENMTELVSSGSDGVMDYTYGPS
jgi:serine/threonine protein kinase